MLERLDMGENQLAELPSEIGCCTRLSWLNFYANKLSQLPHSFSALQNLQDLSFRWNQFTQFPVVLLELKNLHRLDLSGNKIEKMEDSLNWQNWKSLQRLNLLGNKLTMIPEALLSLPNLEIILLLKNPLPPNLLQISKHQVDKLLQQYDTTAASISTGSLIISFTKLSIGIFKKIFSRTKDVPCTQLTEEQLIDKIKGCLYGNA